MSGREPHYWSQLESAVANLNKECAQLAAHHNQMLQLNLSLTSLIDDFSRVHQNIRNASSGKPHKLCTIDVKKDVTT